MESYCMLINWKNSYVRMSVLLKGIYKFDIITIKFPKAF